MASMAVEPCPYCLQITNQGQQPYGPICDNGHRAHLNCIMNQFESNRTFNINTWTCPLCRQPAYNPPLNDALRERFPRRIAALEGVPLMAPVDYLSEGESEEEPDDSQGAFDAYAEALPANETPEAENRINQLITHFPFLGTNYRSEEQDAINSIMDGLTQSVRMLGIFPESAQFQSTVDAGEMGAILMQQWYNIWNMTSAYEGDAEMEEVHSSMTNQSEFFQALTRAIIAGDRRGFWRLNAQQRLDLQVAINFIDPISHAMASLRRRGGKRKKKTRRKRRRGGVGSQPTTPRKGPHKKPPLPLKRPKITFWEKKYRGENEEGTTMNVMQHLTSMDLNDKEAEKEILEVLKYYLNDYKRIPENQQDPEFKKNLEKDITIFQNYVNNQSGGKRRKRKTRKKRGGMDAPPTPPRPPKDNDRGTNRYPPGFILPPVRMAQPQQARMMRRRGSRERLRDRHPRARAPTQRILNEANERLRRSQNSTARNMFGDLVEKCTGSRCGLGGRRKKKRKKKDYHMSYTIKFGKINKT